MSYVYQLENGGVAHCNKLQSVPTGAAYVEVTEIPDAPRESWRIVDGALTFDSALADKIANLKWRLELNNLYDAAMLTLQNGYSNEEVKTFAVKQDAIHEYVAGGIAGLSAENRSMIEALTGSTNDIVLAAKLDNMVAASATFKTYLALIEYTRDTHIDQLVNGQDNSAIVASLAAAYAALGG
tara:strand:- start:293 stop:841 length:549 start_codon:yes stop_codon:yes gene_type:complete